MPSYLAGVKQKRAVLQQKLQQQTSPAVQAQATQQAAAQRQAVAALQQQQQAQLAQRAQQVQQPPLNFVPGMAAQPPPVIVQQHAAAAPYQQQRQTLATPFGAHSHMPLPGSQESQQTVHHQEQQRWPAQGESLLASLPTFSDPDFQAFMPVIFGDGKQQQAGQMGAPAPVGGSRMVAHHTAAAAAQQQQQQQQQQGLLPQPPVAQVHARLPQRVVQAAAVPATSSSNSAPAAAPAAPPAAAPVAAPTLVAAAPAATASNALYVERYLKSHAVARERLLPASLEAMGRPLWGACCCINHGRRHPFLRRCFIIRCCHHSTTAAHSHARPPPPPQEAREFMQLLLLTQGSGAEKARAKAAEIARLLQPLEVERPALLGGAGTRRPASRASRTRSALVLLPPGAGLA